MLLVCLLVFLSIRRRQRRIRELEARLELPFTRQSPGPPGSNVQPADVSGVRQQDLQKKLPTARTHIREMSVREPLAAPQPEDSGQADIVEHLRGRIRELERHTRSAWALELSDEAPPGCSA